MTEKSSFYGHVELTPAWFRREFGLVEPNPFDTDLEPLAEFYAEKQKRLFEKFPELPLGQKDYKITYPVPAYDPRLVCVAAYTDAEPVWDENMGTFWSHRDYVPWANITTVQGVNAIKIPQWQDVPLVRKMRAKFDEVAHKKTYTINDAPDLNGIQWWLKGPQHRQCRFTHFMSFLDLGWFMCGAVDFFSALALNRELSHALMNKCFELSTSYTEFMLNMYDLPKPAALSSLGGDNSCTVSASMYREYAMEFDEMIIDRYGRLPCNLHSCGPSLHLYDVWGDYPNKKDIVLMQTRGLLEGVPKLINSLPDTLLQLTIHQPQFDFENETPENIKTLVSQYAQASQAGNVELVVVINHSGPQVDRNIRSFYQALEELNLVNASPH